MDISVGYANEEAEEEEEETGIERGNRKNRVHDFEVDDEEEAT
jgi:hypothetical protein